MNLVISFLLSIKLRKTLNLTFLLQAIDKAVVGRTVVIVAHRLSTIRSADQIIVMDNHKIVDKGSHDDLLKNSLKYQELIKRQNME